MSAELTQLSALYSAKCLENSQLDEKMSLLLADKENQSSLKYLKHCAILSFVCHLFLIKSIRLYTAFQAKFTRYI